MQDKKHIEGEKRRCLNRRLGVRCLQWQKKMYCYYSHKESAKMPKNVDGLKTQSVKCKMPGGQLEDKYPKQDLGLGE